MKTKMTLDWWHQRLDTDRSLDSYVPALLKTDNSGGSKCCWLFPLTISDEKEPVRSRPDLFALINYCWFGSVWCPMSGVSFWLQKIYNPTSTCLAISTTEGPSKMLTRCCDLDAGCDLLLAGHLKNLTKLKTQHMS